MEQQILLCVHTFTKSVGSDAFTGTLTRTAGENIGNYAITQGNLSAGSIMIFRM
jgi:hypothetical protein